MDRFSQEKLYDEKLVKTVADKYKGIIESVGEDVGREGLLKTPERASKAMHFLTHGYEMDPEEILRGALFHEDHNEMVIIKGIVFFVRASYVAFLRKSTCRLYS